MLCMICLLRAMVFNESFVVKDIQICKLYSKNEKIQLNKNIFESRWLIVALKSIVLLRVVFTNTNYIQDFVKIFWAVLQISPSVYL